jgi:hypothetical protein
VVRHHRAINGYVASSAPPLEGIYWCVRVWQRSACQAPAIVSAARCGDAARHHHRQAASRVQHGVAAKQMA